MVGRVCVGILAAAFLPSANIRSTTSLGLGEALGNAQNQTTEVSRNTAIVSGVTINTENAGETDVDLAISSSVTYQSLLLKSPRRLVVDLQGALKSTIHK